jgi:hypothetical protein
MPQALNRRPSTKPLSLADIARLKGLIASQGGLGSRITDWRLAALPDKPTASEQLRRGFTARAQGLGVPGQYAPKVGEAAATISELNPLVSVPETLADVSVERPESAWQATQAVMNAVPGVGKVAKLVERVNQAATPVPIEKTGGLGAPGSVKESPGTAVSASAVVDPTQVGGLGGQAATTAKAVAVKGLGAPAILTTRHGISNIKLGTPIEHMRAEYEDVGKMLPEKPFPFERTEGGIIIPVRGDPTITGKRLMGLGGQRFETPVNLPGGPGFMRGPQQVAQGLGWASTPGASSTLSNRAAQLHAETGKDVYGFYMKMSEQSGDYAAHMAQTVHERFKQARPGIDKAAIERFDQAMRSDWIKKAKGGYEYPATKDWPGMENMTDEWIMAHPNDRKKMVKMMNQSAFQKAGFPDVGYARWATTEPELLNVPSHSSGFGVIKFDPQGRVTREPQIPHGSYSQQNYATYEGRTPEIPLDVLYEGYSKGINPSHLTKFLETKPPLVHSDQRTVERVLNYFKTAQGAKLGMAGAIAAGLLTERQADEI